MTKLISSSKKSIIFTLGLLVGIFLIYDMAFTPKKLEKSPQENLVFDYNSVRLHSSNYHYTAVEYRIENRVILGTGESLLITE